jgi:prepilin-type N-terminal cleavage/methylation domain-containing protein
MNKKGFTLIELLVVIAIIGILSSVAIVYLADARAKANDAKVKANLTTMSTEYELDRIDGGGDADVKILEPKFGDHPCGGAYAVSVNQTSSEAAFYTTLCSNTTQIYCADSTGYRGESGAVVDDTGVCTP